MPVITKLKLAGIAAVMLTIAACGYSDPSASGGNPAGTDVHSSGDNFNAGSGQTPTTLPDGLQYVDLKVGTGTLAKGGSEVSVQYTGWLSDGTKFDSSRDRNNTPFKLTIGEGAVIRGWEEGLPGMRVGGQRKLIIPPDLGYGPQGQPPTIPANSTLIFDVELVAITPPTTPTASST